MATGANPINKVTSFTQLQLVILLSLVAMSAISTDLYLSGLPQMVEDFSSTKSQVQLTLSIFLFGLAIGQMLAGPLSDQYGRTPILKIGLGIYTAVSLLCAFAPNIETLWVLRFFQGLAASSAPVISRAIVSDVYERKEAAKVLAYLSSAMALIPAIAPIIGSIMLLWFDWPVHFLLLAIFGAVLSFAIIKKLPETHYSSGKGSVAEKFLFIISNVKHLLADRVYIGYVLCGSIAHGAMFAYISSSAYLVTNLLGVPEQYFGYTFAANVLGYILGAFISGKIVQRTSILRLIAIGLVLLATAVLVLLTQQIQLNLTILLFSMFLVFAGGGFIIANAQAAAISRFRSCAGAASAVFGFTQIVTAATAGVLAGIFYNDSVTPMTVIIGLCLVIGALSWYFLLFKSDKKRYEVK